MEHFLRHERRGRRSRFVGPRPALLLLLLLPALACRLPMTAAGQAQTLNEEERLQFANGLYVRGMHELAIREYEQYLKDFPAGASADAAAFRLAECYRELGNKSAAEKLYKRVFTQYPASEFHIKAGFRRADLFMEAGFHDAAIDLYNQVLKESPPPDIASASLYFLATAYAAKGMTNDAVRTFQDVAAKYPASSFDSFARLKLGELFGREAAQAGAADATARLKQALDHYEAVAAKPATDRVGAEALFQIAELYFGRGDYEKSAEAYRRLIKTYPNDRRSAEAMLQAAWAAHNAGLYAEALQRTTEALADPAAGNRSEWLYLKANCERQLVKYEPAIATYTTLIRDHDDAFARAARYELALCHYRLGRYREAIEEAGRIAPEPERKKDVYWLLAESYAALKDDDQAIQYYRLITRDFADSDLARDAMYRLAHHLQAKNDYQEAARFYRSVAEKFPASELAPQSLFASAYCHLQNGEEAESVRDWAELVRLHPDHALVEESLYQKSMGEIRLKRDADAQASLRDLLQRFPKTKFGADAHFWQGMLLKEAGKTHDAAESFRLALALTPRQELARKAEFNLGVALQQLGKAGEAAALLQPLLATPLRESFTPALLEWLAEQAYAGGAYAQAAEAATAIVESSRDPAWLQIGWSLVGRAALAQDQREPAREAFEKALAEKATTPFTAVAALHLGDIHMALKDYTAAAASYDKAAATASGGEDALGIRARAYAGLAAAAKAVQDDKAAARYYMSVAILYDDATLVPACLFEALQAFARLGERESAASTADELIARYPDSDWAKQAQTWKQENATPPVVTPPATNAPAATPAAGAGA